MVTVTFVRYTICVKKLLFVLGICALISVFSPTSASAAQRNVPGLYSSIQAAINASQNGDEVVVSPGTYRENLVIDGKYITVRSTGDVNNTLIAGNPGQTPILILRVPARQGAKTVISGFKITSGYAPKGHGGGLTIINDADPIIENNKIENNTSEGTGGGILMYGNANPLIRNNIIQNNKSASFGGGIFVVRNSSPTITGNQILNNRVEGELFAGGGPSGGGIYIENDNTNTSARSKPIITKNTISGNYADFAGGGIMMTVGVNPVVEDNDITNNNAAYGGGIHIETHGSNPVITGNRIVSNSAPARAAHAGSGHGGGISVYGWSKPSISDNDIRSNTSTYGGAGIVVAEDSNARIQRNNIQSNYTSGSGAEGGGIYVAHSYAAIVNNVLSSNSAYLGGGIALLTNSQTDIALNTIVNNSVGQTNGGGGIFVANNTQTTSNILNNIITSNQKYQIFEDSVKMRIENNDITESGSGMYFSYSTNGIHSASTLNSSTKVNAANNVDGLPAFVNSSTDFNLTSSSAAIGIALNTGDLDDKSLLIRPIGSGIDAGAYEYDDSTGIKKFPVYRFWSDSMRSHFYTISPSEKDMVISTYPPTDWRYEGTVYYAFTSQQPGTIPLYRFWSDQFRGHFYTADEAEKNYVINTYGTSTWRYEGIAYYVYPLTYSGSSKNVDRFWSDAYHHHFYTADAGESNTVRTTMTDVWRYEGPRFKVPR